MIMNNLNLVLVYDETHSDWVVWDTKTKTIKCQSAGPDACEQFIFQQRQKNSEFLG